MLTKKNSKTSITNSHDLAKYLGIKHDDLLAELVKIHGEKAEKNKKYIKINNSIILRIIGYGGWMADELRRIAKHFPK